LVQLPPASSFANELHEHAEEIAVRWMIGVVEHEPSTLHQKRPAVGEVVSGALGAMVAVHEDQIRPIVKRETRDSLLAVAITINAPAFVPQLVEENVDMRVVAAASSTVLAAPSVEQVDDPEGRRVADDATKAVAVTNANFHVPLDDARLG